GVELVDQDTVEAQVGDIRVNVARGDLDPERVRTFLALFIRTGCSGVGDHRGMFAELAVGKDGKNRKVTGSVVSDEDELAGSVEGEVAGIFAERRKLVEERELAGLPIESEGADGTLFASFVDSVSVFAVRVDGHKGWIWCFGGNSLRRELARFRVVGKRVDALARRFVRVRSDEHEIGV